MANSAHQVVHMVGPGANRIVFQGRRSDRSAHQWSPEFWWSQSVKASDLNLATQTTTVTIPSSGFASSTIDLAFSGGPLASPVAVTQTASSSATNEQFAQIIDNAVEAESALDDYVAATAATNVVTLAFTAGQGLIEVTPTITMAQVLDLQFGGTLVDGDYTATFTGGGLGAPVVVTVTRAAGVPANVAAMAVAMETAIEALTGTTLDGVVQSANDDAVDTNVVRMDPNIAAVSIATTVPYQTFTVTVGGTATDGTYSFRINHADLPGGYQTVSFVRGGGETNTQIADGLEVDAEGNGALFAYIVSADNAAAVMTIVGTEGLTGLSISNETAPGSGTLVAAETSPTLTSTDDTPAAYTAAVSHGLAFDVNTVFSYNNVYAEVVRGWCGAYVTTAFPSGSTLDFGDDDPDACLAAVAIDATGWVGDLGTAEGDDDIHEPAWAPVVTLNVGTTIPTSGEVEVWAVLSKHQTGTQA